MSEHCLPVGRVLRSSTASFTIGTKTLAADVPRFGGFVKACVADGCDVIGLIYDVMLEDDLFARQLIGAEVDAEYIAEEKPKKEKKAKRKEPEAKSQEITPEAEEPTREEPKAEAPAAKQEEPTAPPAEEPKPKKRRWFGRKSDES